MFLLHAEDRSAGLVSALPFLAPAPARHVGTPLQWQFGRGGQKPVSSPGSVWPRPRNTRRVPLESPEEPAAWAEGAGQGAGIRASAAPPSAPYPAACSFHSALLSLWFPPPRQMWCHWRKGRRKGRGGPSHSPLRAPGKHTGPTGGEQRPLRVILGP